MHLLKYVVLIAAAAIVSSRSSARAECTLNLNGHFLIHQSNQANGSSVAWQFQQLGNTVNGTYIDQSNTGVITGGNASGASVQFSTVNPDKSVESEFGFTVDAIGLMTSGQTIDLRHPGSSANLSSNDNFCAPAPQGACKLNLNGRFTINQSNGGSVIWQLQQTGSKITGTYVDSGTTGKVVSGTAANYSAHFVALATNGTQNGVYDFTIDPRGKIATGQTIDLKNNGSWATLTSNSNFCSP